MSTFEDDILKIHTDIDKETAKKIKKLLLKYKSSQKEVIEKVAGVILQNMDNDGAIFLSSESAFEIKDGIISSLENLNKDEKEFLDKVLDESYKTAFDTTAKVIKFNAKWDILRQEFIDVAINKPISGMDFSNRIWKNQNELANRIYQDILNCIHTGKRPAEIARAIKKDYGTSAYQAARLVNTELAKTVNSAQMEVYRNSGFVKKVRYSATLESNTCEHCAELDGQIFELDKAPEIPLHPSCRCALIPIVDDYAPTKRADNETKKNIDYTTYSEWQKK